MIGGRPFFFRQSREGGSCPEKESLCRGTLPLLMAGLLLIFLPGCAKKDTGQAFSIQGVLGFMFLTKSENGVEYKQ